jgi:hypothetical protein
MSIINRLGMLLVFLLISISAIADGISNGGGSGGGGGSVTQGTTPWVTSIFEGGNTAAVNASSQLSVNCANCSGSGVSQQDATGFTYGTTDFVPFGGVYNSSISNLTSGQAGAAALTADRNLFVNLSRLAGTALGAPSNYGTSPGAVNVPGVNAFITNSPTVTANAGTNLNTSALALETGGNLATIAGAITSSVVQSNTKQVNGVTTLTGAGAVGTGSQRVAVGQDTTTLAGSAPGTAGTASANVVTVQGVASMTPVQVNQTQVGGTAVVADPCQANVKSNATVSQTTSGTLITGTSGKKNYICSLVFLTSAAAEVSLVEYSGTCTGGTAFATLGSTTAASGLPLAANGGLALGSGSATVVSGAGNTNTGYNVCLLQAGTATIVAQATFVQQ